MRSSEDVYLVVDDLHGGVHEFCFGVRPFGRETGFDVRGGGAERRGDGAPYLIQEIEEVELWTAGEEVGFVLVGEHVPAAE